MPDYHEEERREKAVRRLALAQVVHEIGNLLEKSATLEPQEAIDATEHAMDSLFQVVNMCKPLAYRVEKDDKQAFMWPDQDGFRWVVTDQYRLESGFEDTQEECEAVVDRLLSK